MIDTPVFEVLALGGDGIGPEVLVAGLAVAEATTTGSDIGLTIRTGAYDCEERRGHAQPERKMRNDMIEFKPLTRHIGAEVDGIDLREPLDDDTFRTLHGGLLEAGCG